MYEKRLHMRSSICIKYDIGTGKAVKELSPTTGRVCLWNAWSIGSHWRRKGNESVSSQRNFWKRVGKWKIFCTPKLLCIIICSYDFISRGFPHTYWLVWPLTLLLLHSQDLFLELNHDYGSSYLPTWIKWFEVWTRLVFLDMYICIDT